MEKCFLLVFALVKESKQGQDKIILFLIVILSPPPLSVFFSFRISASISIKCCKTKNKNNQSEMGPMRTQRKTKKPPEVRENADNWVATSFESDCLRESCEVLDDRAMTEQCKAKPKQYWITFDIQLKVFLCNIIDTVFDFR